MRNVTLFGLLLAAAACGRDGRENQEVALGDSATVKIDSASAEPTTPPPADAPKPSPEPATPKPAPEPALPPVTAEQAAAASATVAKVGLSVYPAKGQDKDQTVRDELTCSDWAHQQTGIDPMSVSANVDSATAAGKASADSATSGAAVRGAARGAVGGAAVGAIAGDAGTGAAIGAVAGAAKGRKTKKATEQQAGAAAGAEAEAQAAGSLTTFGKAMSVCLEGKGYSVK